MKIDCEKNLDTLVRSRTFSYPWSVGLTVREDLDSLPWPHDPLPRKQYVEWIKRSWMAARSASMNRVLEEKDHHRRAVAVAASSLGQVDVAPSMLRESRKLSSTLVTSPSIPPKTACENSLNPTVPSLIASYPKTAIRPSHEDLPSSP